MGDDYKPRDVKVADTVNYLSRAFAKAAAKAAVRIGNKAVRARTSDGAVVTTPMYDYQVNFCYLIDKIQRGPEYIAPKVIQEANELITQLEAEG